MFADRAKIIIRSGKGGDGHVSFRREKYVPDGGPDGGDGGRGGDVIFECDPGMDTLSAYRYHRKYAAGDGQEGGKRRCHGKDGQDLILKVPPGTVVREAATGQVIADLSGDVTRQVVLKGGRGGNGNMHYATSTMQAPRYAQPGQESIELEVQLELKLIADVGLVGFPNAGKSTLLSRISHARPKIADYPFTTLTPNLGVVEYEDGHGFVVADIPGLIEGASGGAGLGFEFLRHIQRTRVLIHLVDGAAADGRDPLEDVDMILEELRRYDPELLEKKRVIAVNKIDAADGSDVAARIRERYETGEVPVFEISAVTGAGVDELLGYVDRLLSRMPKGSIRYEQEYFPEEHMRIGSEPFTVSRDPDDEHLFIVEGPRIEKMLGYTNLESEKGFLFFQNFLKDTGILEQLEALGIQDGDTVRMYGLQFDYYR